MFSKGNTDPDLQIKNGMAFLQVRKIIFIFDQVQYKAYNFKSKSFINVVPEIRMSVNLESKKLNKNYIKHKSLKYQIVG